MKLKILTILLLIPIQFMAQVIADKNYHNVTMRVIKLLNRYKSCSSFSKDRKVDEFMTLFENENTLIANDIIHLNDFKNSIKLKDYKNQTLDSYNRLSIDLNILELGKIEFNSDTSGKL